MSGTHGPYQVLDSFCVVPTSSFNQTEVVVRVSSDLISCQRLIEMSCCRFEFTAAVIRKTQCNVCGRNVCIAFLRFEVIRPVLSLLALVVVVLYFYVCRI